VAYYWTQGRTLSDIMTSTRVVYVLPAEKRRVEQRRRRRLERKQARIDRKRARTGVDPASETKIRDPEPEPERTQS
ncbi:MAG: hypothetical protein QNJ98_18090, partial [Planctomycetota bacterium]|nr:hypothetical protein [Planctomycetota bacterium]